MRDIPSAHRLVRSVAAAFVAASLLRLPFAAAQETTRVSVNSSGAEADGGSGWFPIAISSDGAVVAFSSTATNLVAGDTNGCDDVFVHDRTQGTTVRVSVDAFGTQGIFASFMAALSADGQVVAFASYADNLVPNDTNGFLDVFVYDRATGNIERVSVDSSGAEANQYSTSPSLSADGQLVAFASGASNLVSGDTGGYEDVFVHDRATGITERVSVTNTGKQGNGSSSMPDISGDGKTVAFSSYARNFMVGGNGWKQIFVHDRGAGTTECITLVSGSLGIGDSDAPSISADGQLVAFESEADNLVGNDVNGCSDVFVRDRAANKMTRESVRTDGDAGDGKSFAAALSASGQVVAFASDATNLVDFDTNATTDIFVHDRLFGMTERASVDTSGAEADGQSLTPVLSGDGQIAALSSAADDLVAGDRNGQFDVFVRELCTVPASWSNYGAGFPGSQGVPALTSLQNPVLGTTITLYLTNSFGGPTAGVLFVGFQRASLHSGWGGDLLVVPALVLPITFSYGSDSFSGDFPLDWRLCGVTVDVQAIEGDPGAAKGVSFTPGLELVLGR